MGQEPEAIEREIEVTRERMGRRIEALGYKADVRSRTRDAVVQTRDAVAGRLRGGRGLWANPFALALGAATAGVLIGALVPFTRLEWGAMEAARARG